MRDARPAPKIEARSPLGRPANILLIGPYDPHSGEYTFLSPPLGVWRLCGFLNQNGHYAEVFDPNNCDDEPADALRDILRQRDWDVIGSSTTGMTLRFDLELCSIARQHYPNAILLAGGMEATFAPGLVSQLGSFDLVVLGEGEKPLLELARRLQHGEALMGIESTAVPLMNGDVHRVHGYALDYDEFRDAVMQTPYEDMPFEDYWQRLEKAYAIDNLSEKAAREARLSEIRSVRIATLNYCPMACTFCSSTNFLHEVQGKVAKVTRLDADDCLAMIDRVLAAQPGVRTVIWQDDIFVFTNDKRIEPLCDGIIKGKRDGRFPVDLKFISTNRIDAMTPRRLAKMKQAGFRVLGFGVESFSKNVLQEFNKAQIFKHIDVNLQTALDYGLKPFLDLIMSSPRSSVADIHTTVVRAYHWIMRGCEIGLYPYIIPFSGSAMSNDQTLKKHTVQESVSVAGTNIIWQQPQKILPIDDDARKLICAVENRFKRRLASVSQDTQHMPSRIRSLIWIESALPLLADFKLEIPDVAQITALIEAHRTGDSNVVEETPVADVDFSDTVVLPGAV
ncbi:MAG: B12-binding domain-containing radical SAM protein [Woeseiaceae bacterium]|nr:B12-binding domain-containing radical SAM protein [Woeseiaceae bacterium]